MTEYRKTGHVLPDSVREAFAKIEEPDVRNGYAATLRARGWTLQSIAEASGLTRERVRQIVNSTSSAPLPADLYLPVPPPPEKPAKARRVFVEPSPEGLARLLELQPLAQSVHGNSPKNREAGEEYTRLLWEEHNGRGVTLYRLAKRLGVSHGALRFRLGRYGYKTPQTGTSKVYSPIKPENRVHT